MNLIRIDDHGSIGTRGGGSIGLKRKGNKSASSLFLLLIKKIKNTKNMQVNPR